MYGATCPNNILGIYIYIYIQSKTNYQHSTLLSLPHPRPLVAAFQQNPSHSLHRCFPCSRPIILTAYKPSDYLYITYIYFLHKYIHRMYIYIYHEFMTRRVSIKVRHIFSCIQLYDSHPHPLLLHTRILTARNPDPPLFCTTVYTNVLCTLFFLSCILQLLLSFFFCFFFLLLFLFYMFLNARYSFLINFFLSRLHFTLCG